MELLSQFSERKRNFFYEKFSEENGIKEAASDYAVVMKNLTEEFQELEELEESIRRAFNAAEALNAVLMLSSEKKRCYQG